jgi:hypothetical protein
LSKILNRVSMSQNMKGCFSVPCHQYIFSWLRSRLGLSTVVERRGCRTMKRVHFDLSKESKQVKVHIVVVSIHHGEPLIQLRDILGTCSITGSRVKFPRAMDGRQPIQFHTELNHLHFATFTYIPYLQRLYIKVTYTSEIILGNYNTD